MAKNSFSTILGHQKLEICYQVKRGKIGVDEVLDEYGNNVLVDMPRDLLNYIESKCSTHHLKECAK